MADPSVKPLKSIRDLKQHKKNANKGTARGASVIHQSLKEVGAWRSIGVDKNGNIGVGNKTGDSWKALAANPEDVIVVQTDGTKLVVVQRTDLDLESDDPEVRRKAELAAIYDNRASQLNLDWEWTILKQGYEGLGLAGMFEPTELFTANELLSQQATSFLDNVDVTVPPAGAPTPAPGVPPQTSAPGSVAGVAHHAAAVAAGDEQPTIQPASAVGYAAAAARPHHPNSYLDKSGDATTPYTVTSFATSLKQRDFIMKGLVQARDDNGFDNTTTALIWLCSEYLGETLE